MVNLNNILSQNWQQVANISITELENFAKEIPRNPGLYEILTNTPKSVLESIITREDQRHYNFSKKIIESYRLPEYVRINQIDNTNYIVYNGHQKNLRQRFVEHFKGTKGTGCLAIFKEEILHGYSWAFNYLDLTTIENYCDSKLARTYLEQIHRTKIGWPILCSQ